MTMGRQKRIANPCVLTHTSGGISEALLLCAKPYVKNTCYRAVQPPITPYCAGLKVNDQLVAHATRFSIVRLKNHV